MEGHEGREDGNEVEPARGAVLIGQSIGNYVVLARVAAGGMGVVYRAEHPRIRRSVAVKLLHPALRDEPGVAERFVAEARSASEIGNEHIVEVLDFGELAGGVPYLVMEWLDGRSLGDLLRHERRLAPARAIHIAAGICEALAAAHARGIVHRDLKPDNVFLVERRGDPDFVKLLDFGVARRIRPDDEPRLAATEPGALVGTPLYMSPEQCRGAHDEIDGRSDIYSLGAILYQMIAGCPPFPGRSLGQLIHQHLATPPEPPRWYHVDVPPRLEGVILRALEKEPSRRFADAAALSEALRAAISEEVSRPSQPDSRASFDPMNQARRGHLRWWAGGAIVAAGFVGLALSRPAPISSPLPVVLSPDAAMPAPSPVPSVVHSPSPGEPPPLVVPPPPTVLPAKSAISAKPKGKKSEKKDSDAVPPPAPTVVFPDGTGRIVNPADPFAPHIEVKK